MNLRTLVAVALVASAATLVIPAASAACVPVNTGPHFSATVCASTRTSTLVAGGWRSDIIGPGLFFVPNDLPVAFCESVDQGPAFKGTVCYDRTSDPIVAGGWRSTLIGPGAFQVPNVLP